MVYGVSRVLNVEIVRRDEIRAGIERMQFVGLLRADSASGHHPTRWRRRGRTVVSLGVGHMRDGHSELNYSVYHDRYERTPDGWKFAERACEIRFLDSSQLAGSAPFAGSAHGARSPTN